MIGDRLWYDGLRYGYEQHLADSMRLGKPSKAFDEWAVNRAWDDFAVTARYALLVGPFRLEDWETRPITPGSSAGAFGPRSLSRRVVDGLLLVQSILAAMPRQMRFHTKRYLLHGRKHEVLGEARRFVYDWLIGCAQEKRVRV